MLLTALPAATLADSRYEGYSDAEMTEITQVTATLLPGRIIMIGGATTPCSCTEGSRCSSQTVVTTQWQHATYTLRLSRIDAHWGIGVMEAWNRRQAALKLKYAHMPGINPTDWLRAEQADVQALNASDPSVCLRQPSHMAPPARPAASSGNYR